MQKWEYCVVQFSVNFATGYLLTPSGQTPIHSVERQDKIFFPGCQKTSGDFTISEGISESTRRAILDAGWPSCRL